MSAASGTGARRPAAGPATRSLSALVGILVVLTPALAGTPAEASGLKKRAASVLDTAHRGLVGPMVRRGQDFADPNTIASCLNAVRHHVDACEFDLRFTSDNDPVLSHDRSLDGLTDCTGSIARKPLAEVTRCRTRHGERVPALADFLRRIAASSSSIRFLEDIKPVAITHAQLSRLVHVDASHGIVGARLRFSNPRVEMLRRLDRLAPAPTRRCWYAAERLCPGRRTCRRDQTPPAVPPAQGSETVGSPASRGAPVPAANTRTYDVVLLGATGFTGRLTAAYLAEHAPAACRWALAGRNLAKLEGVRADLATTDASLADVPLVTADVTDADSLRALAQQTRVVITTVGPYLHHGEPLVAACAEAGTDYVDLTGEPEFVDRTYLRHQDTAVASGARLVHCCGFDSIPHDLGVLFTMKHLPSGVPVTVRGVVRAGGAFSGGTFHSALEQMSRRRSLQQAAAERKSREPRPQGRRVRAAAGRPHKDRVLGYWLLPLPTIDPTIVKRSAVARADYGPDFTYAHYAGFRQAPYAGAAAVGAVGLVAAVQLPPVRNLLLSRVPQGAGPSEQKRARSWFTVELVGEGGGKRVVTKVSGGDPGYDETAKMLAEAALCLAFDENPPTAGQVTTAAAMGENLLARLVKSGISFTLVKDRS